jgi:hypothetical protein
MDFQQPAKNLTLLLRFGKIENVWHFAELFRLFGAHLDHELETALLHIR